ncbi:hypothetical protein WR25_08849 isoform A [Diploscapter pachys]|uniref:Uncharacterized protein n=2 Tax=Diploscapter pachys TaxID=2018661 RepID=A0A2A2JB33_9BILA|nr:hypothetical protein WR25_08849 isoform A [Diploscapter pachys]
MNGVQQGVSSTRAAEIELKKQKLAEMREKRKKEQEERNMQLLSTSGTMVNGDGRASLSADTVDQILNEFGISPEPNIRRTPEKANGSAVETSSPMVSHLLTSGRTGPQPLEISTVNTVAVPTKDAALYSKTTQTDDERISVGEFSMGSQEFCYDDDMPSDYFRATARTHSHDLESPNPDELATLLPDFAFANKHKGETAPQQEEDKQEQRVHQLSEQEKARIIVNKDFQLFFLQASRVIERAITEEIDIFIDYAKANRGEVVCSADRLVHARTFIDPKWTANRTITGIAFSEQHPELMAVSYDLNEDAPFEPQGVVLVWNTKFKKDSPEYIFHCNIRLCSVTFARFHPHLIVGGCFSGQICVWDNRHANRKTPVNKSPLSAKGHTHPVYSMSVIGTHNAHNLVTISTDGKMCSWNVDNLTEPVDGKELLSKAGKPINCVCMSFPTAEMNNLVVGSEDGKVFAVIRHGAAQTSAQEHIAFDGHSGFVSSVDFHKAAGHIDFSHLFLSASNDWTIKLWSCKDTHLKFSFESHTDSVFDVAWSPVHPAVFASVDSEGNLFLWNLNEDIEAPVSRMALGGDENSKFLRKLAWSDNGQKLCVGDSAGAVHLYDVHDSMYVLKSEEWTRFARVLADLKQSVEEADEAVDAMNRLAMAATAPQISSPQVNVSPRQQN